MKFDERYYETVIKQYGYDPVEFRPVDFGLRALSVEDVQARWLCHHDGHKFARGLTEGKRCIITTGIGLSGLPHIGTISQIRRAVYLQRAGLTVQFVLGDLDSYNARNQPLPLLQERVVQYAQFIRNLGFDESKGTLRNQHDALGVLLTAYKIANCLRDDDFLEAEEDLSSLYKEKGVYAGIVFPVKQAILLMVADFMDLSMRSAFGHVMIMLGVEEHLYVRLAQKVVERMHVPVCVSSIYSRIIGGLGGYPKMSKSIRGSAITVDMPEDAIRAAIMNEPDGPSDPPSSVVYQMMSSVADYDWRTLDRLGDLCRLGGPDWCKAKREFADVLIDICRRWPR